MALRYQVESCETPGCLLPSKAAMLTVHSLHDGIAVEPTPVCGGCGLPLLRRCLGSDLSWPSTGRDSEPSDAQS